MVMTRDGKAINNFGWGQFKLWTHKKINNIKIYNNVYFLKLKIYNA